MIGDIRCLIPPSVKMMALTATATLHTFKVVRDRLAMPDPIIVALPPERSNNRYSIQEDQSLEEFAAFVREVESSVSVFPENTYLFPAVQ